MFWKLLQSRRNDDKVYKYKTKRRNENIGNQIIKLTSVSAWHLTVGPVCVEGKFSVRPTLSVENVKKVTTKSL